jgi:hypothetical protein
MSAAWTPTAVAVWSACLVALAVLPANAIDVDIDDPTANDTCRGPGQTVSFSVEVDTEIGDNEVEYDRLYVNGWESDVNDYSNELQEESYEASMHFEPRDVTEGTATVKVEVEDSEGNKFSDTVSVTIEVDLLYYIHRDDEYEEGDVVEIKQWDGTKWEEIETNAGDCGTTGNPAHQDHTQRYCTEGDTPPMPDESAPPTDYPMQNVLTGSESWTHTSSSAGHTTESGTVSWKKSSSGSNMGHYFIHMPNGKCRTQAPNCPRTELGIHGGGPAAWTTNQQMAVNQGLPSTLGCIRMHNGCEICATDNGNVYWLGWHHNYWKASKGHDIYIYVPGTL